MIDVDEVVVILEAFRPNNKITMPFHSTIVSSMHQCYLDFIE